MSTWNAEVGRRHQVDAQRIRRTLLPLGAIETACTGSAAGQIAASPPARPPLPPDPAAVRRAARQRLKEKLDYRAGERGFLL